MSKMPISLIIDDPAPRVFVFYEHRTSDYTQDGRPLVNEVPNSFMAEFCDVVEKYGIKGKFSIVPMPGGRGDIVNGIPGFPKAEIEEWLDMARTRLAPYFSFCPEILTHAQAVDLSTGELLAMNEEEWSKTQTVETLTPYIAKSFQLLKDAGIEATGVTSPWRFGIDVEDAYAESIGRAYEQVYGGKDCWYFLHCLWDEYVRKPWIAYEGEGRSVVTIPATMDDHIWQTMDTTECSEEYVSRIADELITEDGTKGAVISAMEHGAYPILITHWQSLFSNGLGTGLKVLETVAQRINNTLAEKVEWKSFAEIKELVLKERES